MYVFVQYKKINDVEGRNVCGCGCFELGGVGGGGGGGGSCERGNEYSFSIKIGQYVYQLDDYGLINMEGRPTLITA